MRAHRRDKLGYAGMMLIAVALSPTAVAAAGSRPNVLLIVTDDQRPDSIRALGNDVIRTPNLDRLVYEGTTFTRAITACPICVASRAELLTGRNGLLNGNADYGSSPKEGVPHWASVMRDAGYETCYVGKWHTRGRPSTHGYLRTEGLYAGGGGKFPLTFPHDWKGMPVTGYRGWVFQTDDGTIFPDRGVGLTPNISEDFTDAAVRFLEQPRDQPFFLHVNFTAPHDPLFTPTGIEHLYDPDSIPLPPNFAERHPFDHGNFEGRDEVLYHWPRTSKETRRGLAVYYSVITHLDEQVGRLLKALEERRLEDDTLVIFTSDHGLAMGSHGLRGKQNMYEHSIGVPFIFRGPGVDRGRRTDAQCYLRDLYPTVCDMAGVDVPDTVQGVSLRPVLSGERERVYDEVFAYFRDTQRMVRNDEWKYAVYPQVDREQLFHLSEDPNETNDLAEDPQYADVKAELARRLSEWRRTSDDPTVRQ